MSRSFPNVPTKASTMARRHLLGQDERARAATAWAAVEARVGRVPLMASWIWTSTWLEHFGDTVEHRFLVVEDDEGPCGVALLCQAERRTGPFKIRVLHVGTAGEPVGESACVERNEVLATQAAEAEVHRQLAEAVRASRSWHELAFDGFVDTAAAHVATRATWRGRLRVRRRPAPYHDLRAAATDAGVASVLASGPRRRLRASLRAFADRGPLELDWPSDPQDALTLLDELVLLHQHRWMDAGKPGSFASTRFLAFHRALVAQLVPDAGAAVVRVRCGTETVGCLYALFDGERVLFYQSGLRAYDDNRLRPGIVAHAVFMQACRERGFGIYDFLSGEHRYKRELSTGSVDLCWSAVGRPRLRLRALELARRARDGQVPRRVWDRLRVRRP